MQDNDLFTSAYELADRGEVFMAGVYEHKYPGDKTVIMMYWVAIRHPKDTGWYVKCSVAPETPEDLKKHGYWLSSSDTAQKMTGCRDDILQLFRPVPEMI